MADTRGSEDDLHYDVMVENALRGVVRQALAQVAENGLPGEHHFYVTFRTDHPDVVMPDALKERYPREMTIVLQYQFWDLEVGEDAFSVTLTFNNVSERLYIPFEAIAAFADPSVRFGLQFDAGEEDEDGEQASPEQASNYQGDGSSQSGGDAGSESGSDGGDSGGDDNVVTLDRFRKKQ
jgi:hypothetical protein